jgi:hypothetical protein
LELCFLILFFHIHFLEPILHHLNKSHDFKFVFQSSGIQNKPPLFTVYPLYMPLVLEIPLLLIHSLLSQLSKISQSLLPALLSSLTSSHLVSSAICFPHLLSSFLLYHVFNHTTITQMPQKSYWTKTLTENTSETWWIRYKKLSTLLTPLFLISSSSIHQLTTHHQDNLQPLLLRLVVLKQPLETSIKIPIINLPFCFCLIPTHLL